MRELIPFYKPYKKELALVLLGTLVMSVFDLVFPMAVKYLIDTVLKDGMLRELFFWSAGLFVLYYLYYRLSYHNNLLGRKIAVSIENDLRLKLFKHLQGLSFQFYDNTRTGQLLSRLMGDLTEMSELFFRAPSDLTVVLLTMVGTLIILLWLNLKLGILIALFLLAKTYTSIKQDQEMKKAFKHSRSLNGEMSAQATEALSGVRLVKAFAQEDYELERFRNYGRRYWMSRVKSYKLFSEFGASTTFFNNFTNLGVLCLGGYMITQNEILLSDFIAYLLYVNRFMRPLFRLTVFVNVYQKGMAGFNRFLEVMAIAPEITDKAEAPEHIPVKGAISFEHVTFRYEPGRNVINDLSLTIKQGETIGFVGTTGAGKSTLASLLLRFYEVNEGAVKIDGVDVRDFRQQDLRSQIGLVQQSVFMFSDTVARNIAYGDVDASAEAIRRAADEAAATEFIEAMPRGFDTQIGERGVKLSGGQQQRLAIARVFLKNPPIVVLDEATSALDNRTERQIQHELDKLAENRTTLIIAHRLSTVRKADRIVVLDKGRVAEMGTHEELLKQGGIYYDLYMLQKNEHQAS